MEEGDDWTEQALRASALQCMSTVQVHMCMVVSKVRAAFDEGSSVRVPAAWQPLTSKPTNPEPACGNTTLTRAASDDLRTERIDYFAVSCWLRLECPEWRSLQPKLG